MYSYALQNMIMVNLFLIYDRQDFERNRLSEIITVEVRDIQGLGFPDALVGRLDAVFLDLPQPWLAIPSAMKMLRSNGALCSFSPCIEQVQRSCEALQKHAFVGAYHFFSQNIAGLALLAV